MLVLANLRACSSPQIANLKMELITCQHDWVEQCQLRYRVDPPTGYHWEDAHYPLSEKLGGTETVSLWYPDHIVQGALQTLQLQYPCLHGHRYQREREILRLVYPEYLEIYNEAVYFIASFNGTRAFILKRGIFDPGYVSSEEYFAVRKRSGEQAFLNKNGIFSEEFTSSEYKKELNEAARERMQELNSVKDEEGRSLFALESSLKAHANKTTEGKSLLGVANAKRMHSERNPQGKSKNAVKGAQVSHRSRDENGKSLRALAAASQVNSQRWMSTLDNHVSTAAGVAKHNRMRGWDPDARIRIA